MPVQSKGTFFSIIIPCYNHGHFIPNCLDSIINQSFTDWEVWVINDGSVDNTEELVSKLTLQDSRFNLINQSNQGLSAARNSGIKEASGNYFLFLDADDWLEFNALTRIWETIISFPKYEIYRLGYAYWNHPGGRKYHVHLPVGEGKIFPNVLYQNLGPCHSILIDAKIVRQVGGFDIQLNSCEDWDFWIRVGKLGVEMYSLPELLLAYRYVPTSMSRNARTMFQALSEVSLQAFRKDLRLPDSVPLNKDIPVDLADIQKKHLIRCIGILIHQGKSIEAALWYQEEVVKWNWTLNSRDWEGLSSYLTWRYFLEKEEILQLFVEIVPNLNAFFRTLGYKQSEIAQLVSRILTPQRFRFRHIRYGKIIGAILNRFLK